MSQTVPHAPATAPTVLSTRTVQGACNLCEAICGLEFQVETTTQGERIASVRGNDKDPFSRGHICPKAVALKDLHEDPDRLRLPMKRVGDTWRQIGWDEAFDLVADNLARVREQHGANAVAIYQGNPNVHNWGNVTHGPMFFGQLKTRHRFSATSVDQLPHHVVAYWLYGHQMRIPIPDIDHTRFMLVLGGNPLASNGSLMTVPDVRQRLKDLRQRGGKLVVIDPRRTETAAVADAHHFITPGTDAAWLLSAIHILFDENLLKPGPLEPLLDQVDAVREAVQPFSPEATAALTGIDAATTRALVRELAAADGAVCYGRMGVSTQAHGVVCQWAIQVINLLTGNVDRVGGTLLTSPAVDLIKLGLMGPGHHDVWRSRVRGAPEFSGELPVAVMAEEMLTPGKGQIRALVTACGNPVLSTPNGRQLDQALQGLDFMVSIDFYLNETTRHAHVILPPTCFVEHDHYDLLFWHLAVRNATRYSQAVVAPAEGALHDWQIYAELARRYAHRTWALERSTTSQRLKGLATRSILGRLRPDQLLAIGLRKSSYPLRMKQLRQHPEGIDLGPLQPSLVKLLSKKSRRIKLLPAPITRDLHDMRAQVQAAQAAEAPADTETGAQAALKLIGRRDVRSNNSWMHNSARLVSGKPRCVLWIHPTDAQARTLSEGQTVQVRSRVGQVAVPVHITPDIKPGVVSLPHGWGHDRQGTNLTVAQAHAGASLNDLTDDLLTDRISGNAAFSGVPVQVQGQVAA
ncbi:molybdopterin oxidoreductase family protein [Aquabacterium soli]|uniref:Molybdopterin oxidoreductase family protein n=1 Tax=Aquabacterium soli TaxID=2493092 RepID=A0A3R8S7Q8_9BURK|nr:molybdopterin-dependent oxidoreductase [Aquabacterium soli]RRS04397.1 molybdopterin oxidoreductase family protein [Aquabacterium soli]